MSFDPSEFDFGGWATRINLKCADGRTIKDGAFAENDGQIVPLVWQHQHDGPANILGHALLQNRPGEGVYAYGKFNDTEDGLLAKKLVAHKDITNLSIYANKLQQTPDKEVIHGKIREVSLVLAGANPGAYIDFPVLEHSDGSTSNVEDEATIYTDEEISLTHEEVKEEDMKEKEVEMKESEELAHEDKEKTVKDVLDTLNEEQKAAVGYIIGSILEDSGEEAEHSDNDEGEDATMKHNVFDKETEKDNSLVHADFAQIVRDAKANGGSMKAAVEAHIEEGSLSHDDLAGDVVFSNGNQQYMVDDPSFLFPEARALNNPPAWIKRDTSWVYKVLNGAHHSPFARIKSVFANLTEDEARAKGYIKAHTKKEQVFSLLKRSTTPQTVYKKQKMDRDDVIDITDFDVVAWIKSEMRGQLDEEIARAALIGDGRLVSDDDHISEDHIRPIYNDADLFTIKVGLNLSGTPTEDDIAKAFIRKVIRARKNYRGSGSPTLFTTEDMLTMMLLVEDGIGHPLYADEAALARKLRVKEIVTVPVMEDFQVSGASLLGIIVNMADYNFGADKGGAVNMFDDFDIDVNQMKYLIETRCSGALTVPYSAIAVWDSYSAASDGTDVFYNTKHKNDVEPESGNG